jgi:hypothetical protein
VILTRSVRRNSVQYEIHDARHISPDRRFIKVMIRRNSPCMAFHRGEQKIGRERKADTRAQLAALAASLLVTLFVVGILLVFRWTQVRPVPRDAHGDAPLLVIDGKVYDPDRNPQPVADFSGKKPQIPALTDPGLQAATTARDQLIDLATRASQPHRRAIAQKMAEQPQLPPAMQVRILPPDQAQPLLGDVIPGIVQDAIEQDLKPDASQGDSHE